MFVWTNSGVTNRNNIVSIGYSTQLPVFPMLNVSLQIDHKWKFQKENVSALHCLKFGLKPKPKYTLQKTIVTVGIWLKWI